MLLLAGACKKNTNIPVKKMSKILLSMHLAESYTRSIPRSKTIPDSNGLILFTPEDSLLKYNAMILKEFKISKTEFRNSLDYYKRNPVLLDSIYQMILADIAIMQAKTDKK